MRVSLAVALPERQEVIALELPAGSNAGDAIDAARLAERFPGLDLAGLPCGIWSHPCARDTPLRDGDRVELYRSLQADPKVLRRSRAALKRGAR